MNELFNTFVVTYIHGLCMNYTVLGLSATEFFCECVDGCVLTYINIHVFILCLFY